MDWSNNEEERWTKFLEKELVKEDYCPHCKEHSRLLKVFDCSDRWWRCLSCNEVVYLVSLPISGGKVERYWRDHPPAKDIRAYLEVVEKAEEEEAAREEERKARVENAVNAIKEV